MPSPLENYKKELKKLDDAYNVLKEKGEKIRPFLDKLDADHQQLQRLRLEIPQLESTLANQSASLISTKQELQQYSIVSSAEFKGATSKQIDLTLSEKGDGCL